MKLLGDFQRSELIVIGWLVCQNCAQVIFLIDCFADFVRTMATWGGSTQCPLGEEDAEDFMSEPGAEDEEEDEEEKKEDKEDAILVKGTTINC